VMRNSSLKGPRQRLLPAGRPRYKETGAGGRLRRLGFLAFETVCGYSVFGLVTRPSRSAVAASVISW
jgi:hypothetical protein